MSQSTHWQRLPPPFPNDQGKELIEIGIEKGIEKTASKIALKMIHAGKTDLEISELTDLPLNTIEDLRKKLKGLE